MKVAMLLLAAGRGSRFGGPIPKAYLPLAGRPLLVHSAERLLAAVDAHLGELIVLVHPSDRSQHLTPCLRALQDLAGERIHLRVVDGGASRQESMRLGLEAITGDADLVLIHDAARPLLPIDATRICIETAARSGAALLAIAAPDTLKRARDGLVQATIDRTGVWLAQTPQVMRRDLLQQALLHAERTAYEGTDDSSLVEHLGAPVAIVEGSPTNLKITRPADLPLAEAILAASFQ
ncbi:MAG: 2-C-methyl-D-erythritol 4-phosphate cytidylyltransferase [Planctomycetota bacterium]